jgi:tRNA splicing endonuclease
LYVTLGQKYGISFLVYKGITQFISDDPNFVHSEYLVYVCKDNEINKEDLIRIERISVSTKKKFLIAFFKDNRVRYINAEWMKI